MQHRHPRLPVGWRGVTIAICALFRQLGVFWVIGLAHPPAGRLESPRPVQRWILIEYQLGDVFLPATIRIVRPACTCCEPVTLSALASIGLRISLAALALLAK